MREQVQARLQALRAEWATGQTKLRELELQQLRLREVLLRVRGAIQVLEEVLGQGKPVAIMMHTIMGKGVDFMENDHNWHGVAPNDEQLQKALAQLPETLGDY